MAALTVSLDFIRTVIGKRGPPDFSFFILLDSEWAFLRYSVILKRSTNESGSLKSRKRFYSSTAFSAPPFLLSFQDRLPSIRRN